MFLSSSGSWDMWRAYSDMKEANFINSDKYFHARGNYDAAQRGPGGVWAAEVIRYQGLLGGQGQGAEPECPAAEVCCALIPVHPCSADLPLRVLVRVDFGDDQGRWANLLPRREPGPWSDSLVSLLLCCCSSSPSMHGTERDCLAGPVLLFLWPGLSQALLGAQAYPMIWGSDCGSAGCC